MTRMYKHDCKECIYLGADSLYEQPVDVYYCEAEDPTPTVLVRFGDEPHQYSSLDVRSILEIAKDPGTKTMEIMVKFLKQLSIEATRVYH